MKTSSFVILFSLCFFFTKAQDTLFLKNNEKIAVFVKEVSQTEVQYKKAELIDGPMYITNKNEIAKIVYKNGYTEVLKSTEAEKPLVVQYESKPDINNGKITFQDTKKRYFFLSGLVNRHPDPARKPELMKGAKGIKGMKGLQDGMRTGAVVCGALTIASGAVAGMLYALDVASVEDGLFIPTIAFGSLAVVFTTVSITANINLTKKRKAFVNLYNQ